MKITAQLLKRIAVVLLGLVITGIGVGVFLYAQLGVDPFSVLVTGFSRVIKSSYGVASMILNTAIIVIVLFIDRKYINIASILVIVTVGYSADATSALLSLIKTPLPYLARIAVALVGCVILSAGIALYVCVKLGVGAGDCFSQLVSDKLRFPYRWVRIVCDIIYVVGGWLLGGEVGVGTVIGAFLTGPLVSLLSKPMNSLAVKITGYTPE